ncbi:MAG TPA: hypothetical protein VKU00_03875 [Chthonomonadaceae bacterium]|nr:hypothetical protein [Chthonomonadaceae bacterium]
MEPIRCFFLEPTGRVVAFLIRSQGGNCPAHRGGSHRAENRVEGPFEYKDGFPDMSLYWNDKSHPDWPSACACGYRFSDMDPRATYHSNTGLYRRSDTGEEIQLCDAPAGAMWFHPEPDTYDGMGTGPDGKALMVRTPGGDWCVDSRCSNCGSPQDNVHRCWVRHGDPRQPETVTVDKNGLTCKAGSGSIICGSFHAFLQNGFLRSC